MTKLEAVKYALETNEYKRKFEFEELSVIMEKDGAFLAGTWGEKDYAESRGWTYVGTVAGLARELGLI